MRLAQIAAYALRRYLLSGLRLIAVLTAGVYTIHTTHMAHAAMRLDRTRLILHEAQGRAVIQVRSQDADPLLLQAWLSKQAGQADSALSIPPALPFITDPPVLRLDPDKTRSVHILMTTPAADLPADRESLLWLNILETPATTLHAQATTLSTDTSNQRLFVSFQSQIKVFYRPRTLSAYVGASALPATDRLRFALERGPDGQGWLTLHNPAPIHQSLAWLRLQPRAANAAQAPAAEPLVLDAPMLAPFEHIRLPLPPAVTQTATHGQLPWQLHFATLNDDGHLVEDTQALARLPASCPPCQELP